MKTFRSMKLVLLPALIPILMLAGCAEDIVERKAEKRIAAVLPQYIGTAASYDANIDASLNQMMHGRLRALHITGTKVQLTPNLTVDRVMIDMEAVEFDPDTNELQKVGSTRFKAEIGEAVIQDYVQKAHPEIDGIKITIRKNELHVNARPGILGLKVEVDATGELELADSLTLNFVPTKVLTGGITAPASVVNMLMKYVNPVMDFSTFSYPARLTSIRLEPGKAIASGIADFKPGGTRRSESESKQ